MAAAVGSFRIRTTSRPASSPAFVVAKRWASLKYAGTVMTERRTSTPSAASASFFSDSSTSAESSTDP